MNLQVLVATMHQDDLSIAQKMNIRCGAVIANQADREEIVNQETEFGDWKLITTPTRGVGLNRNIALMASSAEIVLFSDDDVVYNDDMPQSVTNAFLEIPDADVIVFGISFLELLVFVTETTVSKEIVSDIERVRMCIDTRPIAFD